MIIKVKKEYYIYPLLSLVSDFGELYLHNGVDEKDPDVRIKKRNGLLFHFKGGSLGLFVGFSFFALWDIIKDWAAVGIVSLK